jgi:hypothetical protein
MTDDRPRLEEKDLKTDTDIFIIGSIDNIAIAKNEVSLIFKKASP